MQEQEIDDAFERTMHNEQIQRMNDKQIEQTITLLTKNQNQEWFFPQAGQYATCSCVSTDGKPLVITNGHYYYGSTSTKVSSGYVVSHGGTTLYDGSSNYNPQVSKLISDFFYSIQKRTKHNPDSSSRLQPQ